MENKKVVYIYKTDIFTNVIDDEVDSKYQYHQEIPIELYKRYSKIELEWREIQHVLDGYLDSNIEPTNYKESE